MEMMFPSQLSIGTGIQKLIMSSYPRMVERNKDGRFKENNEVVARFELEHKKGQVLENCYIKSCLLHCLMAVNSDVTDYCYQWTGSYCNTDNGSHIILPCNILVD